jgi:ATP-dependent RNA helicase HelY
VSVPPTASRDDFVALLGFEPDPFQVQAMDALDAGRSVLVAAPTGSGKTVVAEYAIAKALAEGGKAYYTTPLKALSNQKFGDLVRRHGADRVGLLTGDNSINGDAPIVVMTTEVLRNMIYGASSALDGLKYVVLDEVHFLQDPYRGPVWEEVIIHAPPEVDLVCLSATVSNAEEVADWIGAVRGDTETIIEERRPVELHQLYMVGDRAAERPHLLPTFVDGHPNPEAAKLDSASVRRGERAETDYRGRIRTRFRTPRRLDVVERLDDEGMLPTIYFIFSRNACDDAVRHLVDGGMRLTTSEERAEIRAIAESKVDALSDDDLRVLDYGYWLNGLECGIAAHHAGMVPPFKETVEACFAAGLIKVVFATETLALGINMPARSVVIEKLTKFTGEAHKFLTPGEYTQLTGRAGRRGIDDVGYAVVLWSPFVPFDQVAGLASTRTYRLTSAFRPTYNMAANLVRRYPPDTAHHLLNLSFAQYQADQQVVRLESQLERYQQTLAELRADATCELGDVDEYRRLRRHDEGRRRGPAGAPVDEVIGALERIRPGDVLHLSGGKSGGRIVVLTTARRKGGDIRVRALTPDRKMLALGPKDFDWPPRAVGHVELPTPFAPNSHGYPRVVAVLLPRARVRDDGAGDGPRRRPPRRDDGGDRGDVESPGRSHPVARCPDALAHVRAAERADRVERDAQRLEQRIRGRTESRARQFDRVLRVMEAWGYVDGWALTSEGEQLARIYHEADLLVAEVLRSGLFDALSPAEVAALASTFTFEHRGPTTPPAPRFPTARLRERWAHVEHLARELNLAEDDAGLPITRQPDPGFVELAWAWAEGDELDDLLTDVEMSGGDFVRNVKQLIDLLRQIGDVAVDLATAAAARKAADALFRGVVAASSAVTT